MMYILSIGSAAVFYSAWYMNLPIFSLGWLFYCLAWIPLFMVFVSANKYDHKNSTKHDLPMPIGSRKIT
jgi:hypothetical protein